MNRTGTPKSSHATEKPSIKTTSKVIIDPDGTIAVTHFTRDFIDLARMLNPEDRRWDDFEE